MNPDFRLAVHVEKGKSEKLAQPGSADRTFLFVFFCILTPNITRVTVRA
jgi:hypothetical protein